ncbi:MAG TPA: GAF domain-containing sensor histidine kinase [Chloroflexota bacterium]|nr:GAF domain-containing sensor histidine kinase [Chloroflexota bacterium]
MMTMLERVTAGEALDRVVRTLAERRPVDDVLVEILTQTRAMLDAAEAYVVLKTDQRLAMRAADGLQVGPAGRRIFDQSEGIEGIAARTAEAVISNDLPHDPRHVDFFDRSASVGSMIAVPLILRGVLLGVLVSTRRQPSRFADVERWWLEIFGGLVSSAIASDQAYRNQERRARRAETLLALSSLPEESPLSRTALAEVGRGFENSRCGILIRDDDATDCRLLTFCGQVPESFQEGTVALDTCGQLAGVLNSGRPYVAVDLQQDHALGKLPFCQAGRGLIATPIDAFGKTRGVLFVVSEQDGWLDDDDVSFLALVGARLGLLLERGELHHRQHEIERQQAQTEARQEFLGVVSHELKTPVAVMRAYAELLLRRAERAGRTTEIDVLRRMGDQAERMLSMIEQLLDSRRLEDGLLTLEVSHFDISELVRRVAHEFELTTVSHRIIVDTPGRLVILADRRRVEEVLNNLLDNAVKYSPSGGTIRVRLGRDQADSPRENVILTVSDDGPGVPERDQDRVFDRFYQAPGRLHKGHTGLGLGLYISRELVRRHGGDMWLQSPAGAGATFFVRLPVSGPPNLD